MKLLLLLIPALLLADSKDERLDRAMVRDHQEIQKLGRQKRALEQRLIKKYTAVCLSRGMVLAVDPSDNLAYCAPKPPDPPKPEPPKETK